MFELLPKQLRVANAIEVRDAKLLFETEIAAVVDVAYEESPARLPRQFVYCRYPLNDGGGNSATMIRLAVRTLVELIRAEMPTAIACSAGVSRSPTIAALAVAELKTVSPNTILQQIAKQRPLQLNAVFGMTLSRHFPNVLDYQDFRSTKPLQSQSRVHPLTSVEFQTFAC